MRRLTIGCRIPLVLALAVFVTLPAFAQHEFLLRADRIFDGHEMREGEEILVRDGMIVAVGSGIEVSSGADVIELGDATLLPGLIDAHTHVLLHPYDETSWNDQVLKESRAERVARATVHLRRTLEAGFTTIRDLGSEGAGYADVGIRQAVEKGIIPGPRILVAGRAIVATGSYGPKGFAPSVDIPLGAEEADGVEGMIATVRDQIGHGVDIVKIYADYRWGPNGEAMPTFSIEEMAAAVETAVSSGRQVIAHAGTAEGMRRATMAGVATIEHGDGGTDEVFALMAERGVALCPTLGAVDAIMRYHGWDGNEASVPDRIRQKRDSFARAMAAGVAVCVGSDAGVFDHGGNAVELELMVQYGMPARKVLQAATSGNARLLRLDDEIGAIREGLLADIVAVAGNPEENMSALYDVLLVMQRGNVIVRTDVEH